MNIKRLETTVKKTLFIKFIKPPLSVICTALKGEIPSQNFVHNVDTLILWYTLVMTIFAKQISRILNFYQTTEHASDATEISFENANKKITIWIVQNNNWWCHIDPS